jgi:hypothetical protein
MDSKDINCESGMNCSALQRKSYLCIPRKILARPQSQFPHLVYVSVNDFYIPRIGPHIFQCFEFLVWCLSSANPEQGHLHF